MIRNGPRPNKCLGKGSTAATGNYGWTGGRVFEPEVLRHVG